MRIIITMIAVLFAVNIQAQKKQIKKIKPESLVYKEVDTTSLELHIYKPLNFDENKQYNAIVFFHGGGWNGGKYTAFSRQASYLASRGMMAISVDYRVRNVHGTTPFDAVNDAKSAMRYVRKNAKELNINPKMIAAGGGSAGGHLAAACGNVVGLEEAGEDMSVTSRPDALVLYNPVYDNSKRGYGHRRMEGRYLEISPLHNISQGAPPTIVFFGTKDKTTPVISSKEYKAKMEAVGSRCDLHLYEGRPHSFFNKGDDFYDTLIKMDQFLVSLGYIEGAPTVHIKK